jgi:hypothetical protein
VDGVAQAFHLVEVVEAVVHPERAHAVLDQGLDPQVEDRVRGEPELDDPVAADAAAELGARHDAPPVVEALPRVLRE